MVFGELELRPLALRSALLRLRAGVLEDFADLSDDLADEPPPPAAPAEELRLLDTDIFTSSVQLPPARRTTNAGGAILCDNGHPILRAKRTFTRNVSRRIRRRMAHGTRSLRRAPQALEASPDHDRSGGAMARRARSRRRGAY